MGCGAAKATQTDDNLNNRVYNKQMDTEHTGSSNRRLSQRPLTPVPKPVAFEIPVDTVIADHSNPGTPKRQFPKRLARLEEQRLTIPSVEDLRDKQLKAEERRQELLEERINKSRAFQQKLLGEKGSEKSNEDEHNQNSNQNLV